jgi:hypothetical protein
VVGTAHPTPAGTVGKFGKVSLNLTADVGRS